MVLLVVFVVAAVVGTIFGGWRLGAEALGAYVFCQVGANSPQTFRGSKEALERIANKALAKAQTLTQKK
jgi:hypothetical protein